MKTTLSLVVLCSASLWAVASPTVLAPPAQDAFIQRFDVLDFESDPAGTIVEEQLGRYRTGPVLISGTNPVLGSANAAILFDSSAPTGGDPDLGSPNEDFGGPGNGEGGEAGTPFENRLTHGKILIVADNLVDADHDGLVDQPGDSSLPGTSLTFDFSAVGSVRPLAIGILDVEQDERPAPRIDFFDDALNLLDSQPLPVTGDNGFAQVRLGHVSGVTTVLVELNGSGAITHFSYEMPSNGIFQGLVWDDVNTNGLQDVGEPGLLGVVVHAQNAAGQTVATTSSVASGIYRFDPLPSGASYTLVVDGVSLPTGYVSTPCNVGSDDSIDNDCSPSTQSLGLGVVPTDFGYATQFQSTVSGRVWDDINGDGIEDPGEPGFAGTLVTLDVPAATIDTTTTDSDGFYEFSGLAPGTYVIVVDTQNMPADHIPSPCDEGGDDTVDSDCSPFTFDLGLFAALEEVDFGFTGCNGSIGDRVFFDVDGDNVQSPPDFGIANVELTLFDDMGNLVDTQITDADGFYEFTGLCAGAYEVFADLHPGGDPAHLGPVICDVGDDDTVDSECGPFCVVLGQALPGAVDDVVTVDFGFRTCAPCAGGIDALSLRYLGDTTVNLAVRQEDGRFVYRDFVDANAAFSFFSADYPLAGFGNEIRIYIDHVLTEIIHTSCSQPIFVGMEQGDFRVLAGHSSGGGALCDD